MQGSEKGDESEPRALMPPHGVIRDPQLAAELERSSSTGSWAVDLATGDAQWSDEMHRIYGTDPSSFVPDSESVSARIHPDDRDRIVAQGEVWRAAPAPFAFVHRVVRPDGDVRHVEARGWIRPGSPGEDDVAVGTAHDITERVEAEAERERQAARHLSLLKDLAFAEERERRRIAGDIHDDSIQAFEALCLRLEGVSAQVPDVDVSTALEGLRQELRAATTRLRTLMFELMPPADGLGLCETIRAYCQRAFIGQDIDWELTCDADEVEEEWTSLVLRLIQELVRNIVQHAHATRAWVSVRTSKEDLSLAVIDDGEGLERQVEKSGHAGMRLIADRVKAVGGTVQFGRPESGRGTAVRILLPRDGLGAGNG
ncbi:MAG TPA: PAS domain-containing protein [Solirubrobacteraceae bacterium]|jgi:PAS domain S-box-containing protein|nr:PAS domain-containing protein [Solirubrobacteraceae bacterium]